MLDSIIDPISDLGTVAGQAAVDYIAARSSLERDGWFLAGLKVLVAAIVFLVAAVGIPVLLIALIWWVGLELLFSG
jgi:hypothetical protein